MSRFPRTVHRRGFLLPEGTIGLSLLGVVAFALAVGLSRERAAERQMADGREAVRAAESTLLSLHAGLAPPAASDDMKVTVGDANPPTSGGPWKWIEVTATFRGQSRSLWGTVPSGGAR